MWQIICIALSLNQVNSHLTNIKELLTILGNFQTLNYVNVLNLDNSTFLDSIVQTVSIPKIIFDFKSSKNYLNLKKYKIGEHRIGKERSLKYNFNRDFMTVVNFENHDSLIFHLENIEDFLEYSKDNLLVLITEYNYNKCEDILKYLHDKYFLNVIYVNIENFEATQQFLTFNRFPIFEVISKTTFKKDSMENVKGSIIKIMCEPYLKYVLCKEKDDKVFGYGSIFNVVNNFAQFVHGIPEISLRKANNFFDITTGCIPEPNKGFVNYYPITSEIFSKPVIKIQIQIAVPKAQLINTKLYILKPMSSKVLILCLIFLIFESILLSLTLKIIKKQNNLLHLICNFLRALISQPFPWLSSGILLSSINMLTIIIGFIVTEWYSAILGSLITTNIYEQQIKTLEDMRKFNMKYVYAFYPNSLSVIENLNESSDLASRVTEQHFKDILGSTSLKTGVVLENIGSEIHYKNYEFIDHVLETNFLRIHLYNQHLMFKRRFDDYLDIVRDSGLFDYWNRNYDLYKHGFLKMITSPANKKMLRILNLNFFKYPFLGFIFSNFVSIFVFVMELIFAKILYVFTLFAK